MKVLCINSNGFRNDGITNSILDYYSYMNKSDMSIDLLETKDVEESLEEKILQIGLGIKFTAYRKQMFRYLIKTSNLIRKQQYDIVHVHGSSALLSLDLFAAWLGGCKVRIAHSRNTKCQHTKIDKLLRPAFYRLCNVRFACGEEAGEWLFPNQRFTVINNGKDFTKFKFNVSERKRIRNQYNLENYKVIGHVGNFNYQKNHEFLIELFSKILKKDSNYRLILIGTGNEHMEKAQNQVKKLGISDKVLFMGSIDRVSEILQAMDLMLLPSRFEGLPNVVLEWQISGLQTYISDAITDECKITNLVKSIPLSQGFDLWAKEVTNTKLFSDEKRAQASKISCDLMKQKGYDIEENAQFLKDEYCKLISSCRDKV